jgi:hypothetical protein
MLAKTTKQQRKAQTFARTKGSKEQVRWDEKETWCLSLPSLITHTIVFLCVSSIHPTLVPSLTSIPSLPIPFPPKPKFMAKQAKKRRGEVGRVRDTNGGGAVFFLISFFHPLPFSY